MPKRKLTVSLEWRTTAFGTASMARIRRVSLARGRGPPTRRAGVPWGRPRDRSRRPPRSGLRLRRFGRRRWLDLSRTRRAQPVESHRRFERKNRGRDCERDCPASHWATKVEVEVEVGRVTQAHTGRDSRHSASRWSGNDVHSRESILIETTALPRDLLCRPRYSSAIAVKTTRLRPLNPPARTQRHATAGSFSRGTFGRGWRPR